MRCLADFILDSDLCLKPGAPPLILTDPGDRETDTTDCEWVRALDARTRSMRLHEM
jgi:hypothetical protein